jgi:hypothetical protein
MKNADHGTFQKLRNIAAIGSAALALGLAQNASADSKSFVVTAGTVYKLATSIMPGERMCFTVYNLHTGLVGTAHFRRTRLGKHKDLDYHTGNACFTSKLGVYVLYATAPYEDLRIVFHGPVSDWKPSLPGPGSQSHRMSMHHV